MGQVLETITGNKVGIDLFKPVAQPGKLLVKWSNLEFIHIYKKFVIIPSNHGFFLTRARLRELTSGSPIEGLEAQLFRAFARGNPPGVNMLELLCAIVIYGNMKWEDKVRFMYLVFDFDGNRCITKDEMAILSAAFFNSIGIMTGSAMPPTKELGKVGDYVYESIGKDESESISLEEFLLWIKDNDEIIELLMTEAEPISNLLPPIMHPKLPTVELRSSTPNRLESSTPLLTRRLTKPAKTRSISTYRPSARYKDKLPSTGRVQLEAIKSSPKKLCVVAVRDKQGGKPYTKTFVVELRKMFNNLDKGVGFVNFGDLIERMNEQALMQNSVGHLSQSLLDKNMNFEEVLAKVCVGSSTGQLRTLEQWANEYEDVASRIKLPNNVKRRLTQNTVNGIKRLFDLYDVNHDGYLDLREVKEAFKNVVDESKVESILQKYDENLDKRVDIHEFIRILAPINTQLNEHVKKNYGINVV